MCPLLTPFIYGGFIRKALSILLCVIIAFSFFTACSKSNNEDTEKTTVEEMEKVSEIPQERIAKKSIEPSSSFAGGDGGKESPFEISNAAELQHFANIFNDIQLAEGEDIFDWQQKYQKAYYVLTNDITVNTDAEMKEADTKAPTYNWQPIGKFSDDKNQDRMYFQGSFDGREHYVSGLYSCVLGEVTGADVYLGLFADATKSTISNVTVKNSYFYVYNSTGGAAALAGRLYESSIENCHVENVKVYAHSGSVAGIVGHPISTNTIVGCVIGGIVGTGMIEENSKTLIDNCKNNSNLFCTDSAAGEIIGLYSTMSKDKCDGYEFKISNCTNDGLISNKGRKGAIVNNACIGGILGKKFSVGCSNDAFIIDSCISRCDFKSEHDSYVGGIAGYLLTSTKDLAEIKICFASGNIDFTVNEYEPDETSKELEGKIVNYVGGIAGTAQDIVIFKNCKADINFKVVSGNRAKVRYDDACPMIVK